jgi:hypothetical protein
MAVSDEFRAGTLAALPQLDIVVPAAIRTAIAGYQAVMALPVPAPPNHGADRRAITALADELARDVLTGQRPAAPPLPLDVTAITRARQDDQDAIDRAALARELRSAAAVVLCQVFDGENAQQVIGAIQAKHQTVAADVSKRARRLPPGADERSALETGGQHRADWLACRDHVAFLARLREALRLVDDGTPPEPVDGLSFCSGWERSGKLAGAWLAPIGATTFGPLGSLEFWLAAGREQGFEWWLPAAAEQSARLAELRHDRQAQRLAAR